MTDVCSSCGLAVAGGVEGCQRLFESLGLREFEDMRFARYHRIVVDVYAMQHPDRYGAFREVVRRAPDGPVLLARRRGQRDVDERCGAALAQRPFADREAAASGVVRPRNDPRARRC
jgi:hypothetical protein